MTLAGYWDAPAERLAALRIFIGTYALAWVLLRVGELIALSRLPDSHFRPVGVVRVLSEPLPTAAVVAIAIVTAVLLAGFVVGFAYRIVAPLAAVALLWTLTYRNSWGMVFHTENLVVLHVLALAVAPAADAWAIARRPAAPPEAGYGWAIRLLAALTVATYLLAGIAKLRIAGLDWIDGEMLRNQIAIDNLRKALLGDLVAPIAVPLLDHPGVFTGFCALTLALELGAPLALLGNRGGRWWAAAAWGFHVGVVLLMNIWFLYPLVGFAYLPLLRAERPIHWLIGRWQKRSRSRGNAIP